MGIELGQVIDGKYRVTAVIGEGGMGAVFAGEHLKLHRRVAIKVLKADAAGDPETVRRFEREAQAAGRIGNDHILEILDIGALPDGSHFMVMEFLDGEPMNVRLARRRLSPREIYPLARQVLDGLAAAHAVGIVHRDLKPANLFILKEKAGVRDYVKIIDFGISKFQIAANEAQHNQTQTGTIIGTPRYMSPEQARGLREADARSDLWSLGVILYEAVTGRCPFEGASTNDILFKIFTDEPPQMDRLVESPDPAFNSIVMKVLAKDPNERFPGALEFIATLDAWFQNGQGALSKSPASVTGSMAFPHTLRDRPSVDGPPARQEPSARTAALPRTLPGTERSWEGGAPPLLASASLPTRTHPSPRIRAFVGVAALVAIGGVVLGVRRGGRHDLPVDAAPPASTPDRALPPPPVTPVTFGAAAHASVSADAARNDTKQSDPPPSLVSMPRNDGGISNAVPATSAVLKSTKPHSGSKATKPECESPYYVDSTGARVFKEQCL